MAICKTCGRKYSKFTTPVSARGVCRECFFDELDQNDEVAPIEQVAPAVETQEIVPERRVVPIRPTSLRPVIKSYSFLPKSDSKVVFVLVMACFSVTAASLCNAILHAFRLPPPPEGLFRIHGKPAMHVSDLLFLAPIFETLLLIAVMELLRWAHSPLWLQISGGAIALALDHSASWRPWGLIVAPAFAIDAFSYAYWRPNSRKVAFGITACIHALHNLIPAISVIAYAIRNA